jgi:hypothetical protein
MIPNVKEWLEKQGFLLEMKTAAAFRQAGFEVRQCSHYVDPDSGKSRESTSQLAILIFSESLISNLSSNAKLRRSRGYFFVPHKQSAATTDCLHSRRCLTIVVTSSQSA